MLLFYIKYSILSHSSTTEKNLPIITNFDLFSKFDEISKFFKEFTQFFIESLFHKVTNGDFDSHGQPLKLVL